METIIFATFGICCATLICTICTIRWIKNAAEVTAQMYRLLLKNSVNNDMIVHNLRKAWRQIDTAQKDGDR